MVKQEPLDIGVGYTYTSGMPLDQTGNLGYTASLFLSSNLGPSPDNSGPLAPSATVAVTSVLSSTEGHTALTHSGCGLQEGRSTLPSDYTTQDAQLPLSNNLEAPAVPGEGQVCGDLDMEGKELAKLQTVQMDADSDLWPLWAHYQKSFWMFFRPLWTTEVSYAHSLKTKYFLVSQIMYTRRWTKCAVPFSTPNM